MTNLLQPFDETQFRRALEDTDIPDDLKRAHKKFTGRTKSDQFYLGLLVGVIQWLDYAVSTGCGWNSACYRNNMYKVAYDLHQGYHNRNPSYAIEIDQALDIALLHRMVYPAYLLISPHAHKVMPAPGPNVVPPHEFADDINVTLKIIYDRLVLKEPHLL